MHASVVTISDGFLRLAGRIGPMLREMNAMDRLQAARQLSGSGGISLGRLWWALMLIVLAAAVGVLISFALRGHRKQRRWAEFRDEGARKGLSGEELKLLTHMFKLAGLKNPLTIYTADSAFDLGVARLMQGEKVASMSDEMRGRLSVLLASMREKLGFQQALDTGEAEAGASTRQITTDSKVFITPRAGWAQVEATVVKTSAAEFEVQADEPLECRPGETWLIRHSAGSAVWEFEAAVIRGEGERVVLAHSGRGRVINRRRFPRVPTNMPAQVAMFAFSRADASRETPEFVPATLIEIAGPGLLLKTPCQAEIGTRVLVVVGLGERGVVQGLAKVRRTSLDDVGNPLLAVELVGLDFAEVAELVRETNLASARLKTPNVPEMPVDAPGKPETVAV